MSASWRCLERCVACVAAWLTTSASLHAEADVRTEMTCVLQSPELVPDSDSELMSTEPTRFDFDELASHASDDRNALRVATALDEAGYWPGVTARARLRLELGLRSFDAGARLRDMSSWLGFDWQGRSLGVGLRAYPFDTDYLRVGHLHWLDWGGTDTARGESIFVDQEGGVPGFELELRLPRARLFTALKWTDQDASSEGERRRWGVLWGGQFRPLPSLKIDAGFGYFQRSPARTTGASRFVEGASVRLVYGVREAEPELASEPFRAPHFRDQPYRLESADWQGSAIALEVVSLVQRLQHTGVLTLAPGAAIYGSARGSSIAAHAAVAWRSFPFVLRSSHGLLDGGDMPTGSDSLDELAAWAGISAEIDPVPLVPSLELGCLLPAALRMQSPLPGFVQTFLVRDGAHVTALPLGADRLPVFASRVGVRLRISASLSLGVFGSYERDANRVGFRPAPGGPARVFARPDSASGTIAGWTRF